MSSRGARGRGRGRGRQAQSSVRVAGVDVQVGIPAYVDSQSRKEDPLDLVLLDCEEHLLDRMFVHRARLVPFSHRSMCSLRHPRMSEIVANKERVLNSIDIRRLLKRGKTKPCTTSDLVNSSVHDSKEYFKREAQKWANIGHMFDHVAQKPQIAEKRHEVLQSHDFRSAVELWWSKAAERVDFFFDTPHNNGQGPEPIYGILKRTYHDIHERFYDILFSDSDDYTVTSAIGSDWVYDRSFTDPVTNADGETPPPIYINYRSFYMSLFELVDNWLPLYSDQYTTHHSLALFLLSQVKDILAEVSHEDVGPEINHVHPPARTDTAEWTQKKQEIISSYRKAFERGEGHLMFPTPAHRPISNLLEYVPEVVRE